MYLLYRLSSNSELRGCVPEIAVFLSTVSLISTCPFGIFFLGIYVLPIFLLFTPWLLAILYMQGTLLSFPLFITGGSFYTLGAVHIQFFAVEVFSKPSFFLFDISVFSFFLLTNTLGALLGYLIGRKCKIRFRDGWRIPCGLAGIACIGIALVLASVPALYEIAGIGTLLLGLGVSLLDIALLSWLIDAEFLSLLRHARIATFLVIGGLILFLTGSQISQVPMTIGGQALIAIGVAMYIIKLVLASARPYMRSRNANSQSNTRI